MKVTNPFPVAVYHGPKYFCDRENELLQLRHWVDGGVPSVLIGIRRLGKTGLIRHLFHHLEGSYHPIFIDLQGTESLTGFVEKLAEGIGSAFPEKTHEKLWQNLKSLRPTIEFDPYTGLPQISFTKMRTEEAPQTLHSLLSMLNQLKEPVVIALDEFQQITTYPETQVEGTIRAHLQTFPNLRFLFSGSQTHLLSQMFASGSRPFFSSAQRLFLQKLNNDVYLDFLQKQFASFQKDISTSLLQDVLDWTETHTYYTQYFCNQLFQRSDKTITATDVLALKRNILEVSRNDYFLWKNVLAGSQWKLLVAIAHEQALFQPFSSSHQRNYELNTPNATKKALQMLLDNQLVNEFHNEEGERFYKLADVFMMRFIQHEIR